MASGSADEGQALVACPSGGEIFGLVDGDEIKAAGIAPGFLRLQVGYPGPKGFGLRHVESYDDRMRTISGLGFKNFPHFCEAIGKGFTKIGKGDRGRLLLIMEHQGYAVWLIVELRNPESDPFWTIVTGVINRLARCEVLCEVTRTSECEPTLNVAKRSRFETLSLPKKVEVGCNGS
jgi:hypothetical protein